MRFCKPCKLETEIMLLWNSEEQRKLQEIFCTEPNMCKNFVNISGIVKSNVSVKTPLWMVPMRVHIHWKERIEEQRPHINWPRYYQSFQQRGAPREGYLWALVPDWLACFFHKMCRIIFLIIFLNFLCN